MFLRFQRLNIIETDSSSSDSDANEYDTLKLMENDNPMIRLMIYGKLKKMITSFRDSKLQQKDINLIRGL